MGDVLKIKRKAKPLTKTYQPMAPYVVERQDEDEGDITYEVVDERPDSYRTVCICADEALGKHDAEQIARGLNMLVQYGKEKLPSIKDDLE